MALSTLPAHLSTRALVLMRLLETGGRRTAAELSGLAHARGVALDVPDVTSALRPLRERGYARSEYIRCRDGQDRLVRRLAWSITRDGERALASTVATLTHALT